MGVPLVSPVSLSPRCSTPRRLALSWPHSGSCRCPSPLVLLGGPGWYQGGEDPVDTPSLAPVCLHPCVLHTQTLHPHAQYPQPLHPYIQHCLPMYTAPLSHKPLCSVPPDPAHMVCTPVFCTPTPSDPAPLNPAPPTQLCSPQNCPSGLLTPRLLTPSPSPRPQPRSPMPELLGAGRAPLPLSVSAGGTEVVKGAAPGPHPPPHTPLPDPSRSLPALLSAPCPRLFSAPRPLQRLSYPTRTAPRPPCTAPIAPPCTAPQPSPLRLPVTSPALPPGLGVGAASSGCLVALGALPCPAAFASPFPARGMCQGAWAGGHPNRGVQGTCLAWCHPKGEGGKVSGCVARRGAPGQGGGTAGPGGRGGISGAGSGPAGSGGFLRWDSWEGAAFCRIGGICWEQPQQGHGRGAGAKDPHPEGAPHPRQWEPPWGAGAKGSSRGWSWEQNEGSLLVMEPLEAG